MGLGGLDLTSLALDVTPDVLGHQLPRICHVPASVSSAGAEAVELAALAGLELDPWEEFVLTSSLGERKDGKWAAFQVGLCVPRQNGKSLVLAARELAGLFLLGEREIMHTAHLFKTSLNQFKYLLYLIESTPEFDRKVAKVSRSHGEEGITLRNGQAIGFATRTAGGGRGLTGDLVVLDEAFEISEATAEALFPTMAARSVKGSPQVWFAGSAVDEEIHQHGAVFSRVRHRGMTQRPDRLMYCEWSIDADEFELHPEMIDDPRVWAVANPGQGIRISEEFIVEEREALTERGFARERLGIGHWLTPTKGDAVISAEGWAACVDESAVPGDPVVFAFDVSPDRSRAAIGVAGRDESGLIVVEVIRRGRGTGWIAADLDALLAKHRRSVVVCDAIGPAGAVVGQLEHLQRSKRFVLMTGADYAASCGAFYDAVENRTMRHRGTAALSVAVAGAKKRALGEKWAWGRIKSETDVTPLVATTLALGYLQSVRRGVAQVINPMDVIRVDRGGEPYDFSALPEWVR
jgi:hypothetical protein